MADDDPCEEETWSWWHFKPEQVDPYWIRCGLTFPHDEHEDSNTGLTWKKEPVEDDEYMAKQNKPAMIEGEALADVGDGYLSLRIDPSELQDSFLITSDSPLRMQRIDYAGHTSEMPFSPAEESSGEKLPFMATKENTNYPERARALVYDFIREHLEVTDTHVTFSIDEVYTVWFCKTLQNWKGLFSTTLPDGMYYEVTYDGEKNRAYIDAYKKFKNVMVLDSTLY